MKKSNIKSPLDIAYNRLDEAHRAWHLALNGYHKIDDFRAGINSAIQSLRNLTFALQSEKSNFSNFDSWYESWRIKMRDDLVLKELNGARNIIVKQEDLKLKSKATAQVKGWENYKSLCFEFDPMSDSYAVAKGFYNNYVVYLPVSKENKSRFIFNFERKWIYEKLPDVELLEAVAYSYHFFWEMLKDAEKVFSLPQKNSLSSGDFCQSEIIDNKFLRCMAITRQERSLIFSLENGGVVYSGKTSSWIPTEDIKQKTKKRYGDMWKSKEIISMLNGIFVNKYPFDQVKKLIQIAIASIKRDKYLVPMSFIFTEKHKPPMIISHTFQNQQSKIIAINKVADEIIKIKGTSILQLGEAWLAPLKKDGHNFPLQDRKDTKDVVLIHWVSSEMGKVITIPFKKNIFNQIIFSKIEVEDFDTNQPHKNFLLLPLIEALQKVKNKNPR
ncbi:MAG: hypothetical protein WCW93_01985 [Candidatus Paceibacterota bacterium]